MKETFHIQHLLLKEPSHENIATNSVGHARLMSCILLPLEPFITGESGKSPKMLTLNALVNQKPSHFYNSKTNLVVSTKERL